MSRLIWLANIDQAVEIAYEFGVQTNHPTSAEDPARHEYRYAISPRLPPVGRHEIHARFDGGSLPPMVVIPREI